MQTTKIAFIGNIGAGKDLSTAIVKRNLMLAATNGAVQLSLSWCINAADELQSKNTEAPPLPFIIDRFALPIKAYIASSEGLTVDDLNDQQIKKGQASSAFGCTIRECHLKIADAMKALFGIRHFVQSLINRLAKYKSTTNIVVVDCRYVEETTALKNAGFVLVQLHNMSLQQITNGHSSETEQQNIKPDAIIHHDGSNPFKLARGIADMMLHYHFIDKKTYDTLGHIDRIEAIAKDYRVDRTFDECSIC